MGVIFGLSLGKYVESLIGSILGSGKVYLEDKIVGLILGGANGTPLDIDLG